MSGPRTPEAVPHRIFHPYVGFGLAVVLVQVVLMVTTSVPAAHSGGDNAGYVSLAHAISGGSYVELWDPGQRPHTKYPPVFSAILALWVALGATTWTALKTAPALFTTLSVVTAFLWVAGRRGPWLASGIALVLAASSAMLWSSHWILSDPTFLAFTFLALWAIERSEGRPEPREAPGDGPHVAWLVVGVGAAILASFTRSAGLPLLLAIGAWLALGKRWKSLTVFGAAALLPTLAWWVRARRAGDVQYVSEFWLVDPYTPELGTVDLGTMFGRVAANAQGYVLQWIPEGLIGPRGAWLGAMGIALCVLAVVGWMTRFRKRVGPAELFFALYAGLILLWPQVWSGDRFALPLFPLLLFYAAEALTRAESKIGVGATRGLMAGAFLTMMVPALISWGDAARDARACRDAVNRAGSFACYGPRWTEFIDAARWSGENLPPEAVVLTRKPRIFFVMGGRAGRTYPYSTDADAFLSEATQAGASHVLLDHLDRQGMLYVGGAVGQRPEAFCSVEAFTSGGEGVSTQLLGLLAPGAGGGGRVVDTPQGQAISLPPCPAPLRPVAARQPPSLRPGEIPLLTRR